MLGVWKPFQNNAIADVERHRGLWVPWWTSPELWIRPRRSRGWSIEVEALVDSLQGPVDIRTRLEIPFDPADRVEDGRVVAVEAAGDLGEGEVGLVAGHVHGELPAANEVGGAARRSQ